MKINENASQNKALNNSLQQKKKKEKKKKQHDLYKLYNFPVQFRRVTM